MLIVWVTMGSNDLTFICHILSLLISYFSAYNSGRKCAASNVTSADPFRLGLAKFNLGSPWLLVTLTLAGHDSTLICSALADHSGVWFDISGLLRKPLIASKFDPGMTWFDSHRSQILRFHWNKSPSLVFPPLPNHCSNCPYQSPMRGLKHHHFIPITHERPKTPSFHTNNPWEA